MYIPGRSRTGSSPSRTVMSFAVYVVSVSVSAIKKALQIPHLRALRSVSERAVARGPREACASGSRHELAQLGVLDLGGPAGGVRRLFQGSRRRRRDRGLGDARAAIRQRPREELQLRLVRQARADLVRTVRQLEGPDGVAGMHDERAVALEAGRPRVARDLFADRGRPRVGGGSDLRVRAEAAQFAPHLVTERIDRAPPPPSPRAADRAPPAASQ